MTDWNDRAEESARRHKVMLALGLDYCAGCGDYVEASSVSNLSGFPICRPCGRDWVRTLASRRRGDNGEG